MASLIQEELSVIRDDVNERSIAQKPGMDSIKIKLARTCPDPVHTAKITCLWRRSRGESQVLEFIETFDLIFAPLPRPSETNPLPGDWLEAEIYPSQLAEFGLAQFVMNVLSSLGPSAAPPAFKVIVPKKDGYWTRTNLISQRMWRCQNAAAVKDVAVARKHYSAPDTSCLWQILATTLGMVHARDNNGCTPAEQVLGDLQADIINRLSFPLLVPDRIPRYRVALLHGRPDWTITEQIYFAAAELDIEVYILDHEDHWMRHGRYTSFREDFIPIDIANDEGLPGRVVDALQQYPIQMDGLVSFSDLYLIPAARAAKTLGLSTSGVELFETCRDKYTTRMVDRPKDFQCFRVSGSQELTNLLERTGAGDKLKYPLIVKPCAGGGSEGVSKVTNVSQLVDAVAAANKVDYGRGALTTIETYISGPEVDCNFIMWDGEPLFCEISDEFPTTAETREADAATINFTETDMFLPTALPSHEQELIKRSMLRVLHKLGCQNGVFHMEARVRDSSMEYQIIEGYAELKQKPHFNGLGNETSVLLIENNCRPPNSACCFATQSTYGIDYYAIHWLTAVREAMRVRALAMPFLKGPQHHCDEVMIPVVRGGWYATHDAVGDFVKSHVEVSQSILRADTYFQYGDEVPDPSSGVLTWIAYFIIADSSSRQAVIETAKQIREGFQYRLVQNTEELHSGGLRGGTLR
nr:fumipyrrole biosynthesis protein c [Quercus suber]